MRFALSATAAVALSIIPLAAPVAHGQTVIARTSDKCARMKTLHRHLFFGRRGERQSPELRQVLFTFACEVRETYRLGYLLTASRRVAYPARHIETVGQFPDKCDGLLEHDRNL